MAVVSDADVIAWAAPGITGYDSAVLNACIDAAQGDAENILGFTLGLTQRSESFNGSDAWGKYRDTLVLSYAPVVYAPGTHPLTVTEDGVTLTVQFGHEATQKHVTVRNANHGSPAAAVYIYRNAVCWSPGRQNIAVTYKSGYDSGGANAAPAALVQVIKELAWLYFKAGRGIGTTSATSPSHSAANRGDIPPSIVTRLSAWRIHWR